MPDSPETKAPADMIGGAISTELASGNTSLAFERTRMAADRTLAAMVRTALSLIGFGASPPLQGVQRDHAQGAPWRLRSRRPKTGAALLGLGLLLLVLGIDPTPSSSEI